jgi:hypothetical protein
MKTPDCERYIEDPEANASHLATCAECRALFGATTDVAAPKIDLDALPLAPWEGAQHRPWPLVMGAALAIFAIACALFAASGASPTAALGSTVPSFGLLELVLQHFGDGVQHAPAGWHVALAVAFLVVNTLLVVLLRRAPKGLDV